MRWIWGGCGRRSGAEGRIVGGEDLGAFGAGGAAGTAFEVVVEDDAAGGGCGECEEDADDAHEFGAGQDGEEDDEGGEVEGLAVDAGYEQAVFELLVDEECDEDDEGLGW